MSESERKQDRDLRRRAEQRLEAEFTELEKTTQKATPEIQRLLRELKLHQIELEMQNEELRRSWEALELSQARYFDLYQAAPVGYLTLDSEGKILEVNLVASKLLGEPPHSLFSQSLAKFVHPEDGDDFYLRRRELLKTGHLQAFEMRLRGKDGPRPVLVEATLNADAPADSRLSRIILIDISEKMRLWSQLLHSQKMEAMGLLTSGIAHNFNNSLAVVKANSELILAEMDDEDPHKDMLLEILQAGEDAAQLTSQLLNVGEVNGEESVLFDLNRVVAHLLLALPDLLGDEIVVENEVSHEVLQVNAVPEEIETVLRNFVLNARDAMLDGGVLVLHTCRQEVRSAAVSSDQAERSYAVVSVRDSGTGIPPGMREQIFDQFFTTKDKSEGAGLGLTAAYAIARKSSGYIEFESELGKGSSFSLFLPLIQTSSPRKGVERLSSDKRPTQDTLLIVDDDDSVRKIACRILEREGYKILTADSGEQGIEVFHSIVGGPSLLLTDVVMPKMSGLQLASILKENKPDLNILFMSGYPDDVLRNELAPAGAKFLSKPFSRLDLCERVRELLDGEPEDRF